MNHDKIKKQVVELVREDATSICDGVTPKFFTQEGIPWGDQLADGNHAVTFIDDFSSAPLRFAFESPTLEDYPVWRVTYVTYDNKNNDWSGRAQGYVAGNDLIPSYAKTTTKFPFADSRVNLAMNQKDLSLRKGFISRYC